MQVQIKFVLLLSDAVDEMEEKKDFHMKDVKAELRKTWALQ